MINDLFEKFLPFLFSVRNFERKLFLFQDKMSMTGSLMGYENNNEINQAKCKKPLKPLPIVSSINSSGITTTNKTKKPRRSARRSSCIRGHVNSLWSVWYGVLAVAFQAYIGLRYAKRFAGKWELVPFYFPIEEQKKEGRERMKREKKGEFFQRIYRYLGPRTLRRQRWSCTRAWCWPVLESFCCPFFSARHF